MNHTLKHILVRLGEEHEARNLERSSTETPFAHRRLIFRPGFTVKGMSAKLNDTDPASSHGKTVGPINRQAKAVKLPGADERLSDLLEAVREGQPLVRKKSTGFKYIMGFLLPQEIWFMRRRQFQHDPALWTPGAPGNEFTPGQIEFALDVCGERWQENNFPTEEGDSGIELKRSVGTCVQTIDFGGYLPLTDRSIFVSTKLKAGFPGLRTLVLPYIPNTQSEISTAKVILSSKLGLRESIGIDGYALLVSLTNPAQLEQFTREIAEVLIQEARAHLREPSGRLKVNERELRRDARALVKGLLHSKLSSVQIFYEQHDVRDADVSQGQDFPVEAVKLNFPPDLLDDGPGGGPRPGPQPPTRPTVGPGNRYPPIPPQRPTGPSQQQPSVPSSQPPAGRGQQIPQPMRPPPGGFRSPGPGQRRG